MIKSAEAEYPARAAPECKKIPFYEYNKNRPKCYRDSLSKLGIQGWSYMSYNLMSGVKRGVDKAP